MNDTGVVAWTGLSKVPVHIYLYIVLCYAQLLLSLFLYVTIFKFKELHTPGYFLLVSHNVAELLASMRNLVRNMMGVAYILTRGGFHLDHDLNVDFNIPYFSNVIPMALLSLAVHRYHAVVHYTTHRQVFTKTRAIIMIAVCWILNLYKFATCNSRTSCQYHYSLDHLSVMGTLKAQLTQITITISNVITVSCTLASLVLYAVLFLKYRSTRKSGNMTTASANMLRTEIKLAIQFFIVTVTYISSTIIYLVIFVLSYHRLMPLKLAGAIASFGSIFQQISFTADNVMYVVVTKDIRTKTILLLRQITGCCRRAAAPAEAAKISQINQVDPAAEGSTRTEGTNTKYALTLSYAQ